MMMMMTMMNDSGGRSVCECSLGGSGSRGLGAGGGRGGCVGFRGGGGWRLFGGLWWVRRCRIIRKSGVFENEEERAIDVYSVIYTAVKTQYPILGNENGNNVAGQNHERYRKDSAKDVSDVERLSKIPNWFNMGVKVRF